MPTRCISALGAIALSLLLGGAAAAQSPAGTIRIGVLNDMSGPFADLSGKGSVIAAQMAAEDFAKEAGPGAPRVEILSADHQNKADVGAAAARKWVDQDGVAAVVDVPNSAVALAVNQVMREKDRAFLASSSATSDLTGPQCAPTTVQWTFDTWALANGTARALVQQGGGHVVLPHRRLRVRPGAGARRERAGQAGGRQGAGRRSRAARYQRLLRLPPPSSEQRRQGDRARQRRHGHQQRH